jgi:hypothetical protein
MVLWSTWMGQPEPLNKASTILEWNLPNSRVHSNLSPWLQTSCKWGVVRYAKKACCETKLILGLFMQVSAMQNSSARMLFYTDSQRSLAKDLPKVHPPSLNNPRLSKTSCLNDQGHRPFMASKKRKEHHPADRSIKNSLSRAACWKLSMQDDLYKMITQVHPSSVQW